MAHHDSHSLETILTFENRNVSQWSMVWSTANIPGMDTATGGGARRSAGRRRLRLGAFVLGALLSMHCRVTAAALSGCFFLFVAFLFVAVVLLANPLRHFEIYLGQWSISGPGRAFRIIPMFDGIGIAICISALVRAICCCTMAAITAIYIWHAVSDSRLPFTYCRDFNLKSYEPALKDPKVLRRNFRLFLAKGVDITIRPTTVGLFHQAWRNASMRGNDKRVKRVGKVQVCKELYSGRYPPLLNTPAYNFFYVEVMQLRPDLNLTRFNIPLLISIGASWLLIWIMLIVERILHGRLIWNNTVSWFCAIPCLWAVMVLILAVTNTSAVKKLAKKSFRFDGMEITSAIADAFQVALYIHSASTGSELIHGKGLNHYASGHLDPLLNGENVWHSVLVFMLAAVNSISAIICSMAEYSPSSLQEIFKLHESTMWVIPMFSKCSSSAGTHSHFITSLTFGGLTFSYMVVTYIMMKTALHTIFEYRVRLIFIEQVIVALLVFMCMGLSVFFATNGGVALLDSVDALATGLVVPLVCFLELVGMLCVYRSRDFVSDMNIATEENTCSTRIGFQWKIIPVITFVVLGLKIACIVQSDLPSNSIYIALYPLLAILLAIPLRSAYNAYNFFRHSKLRR